MKEFATDKENKYLKISDRMIALSGKDFHVWEVKAEHITELCLTDRHKNLEIVVNVLGNKDTFTVDFPKEIYIQVREFLTNKLQNVKVREASKVGQMIVPVILTILAGGLTIALMMSGKEESEGGVFSKIANFSTEQFGSSGILLGGGAITGLCALYALKVYLFPKKGAIVGFKKGVGIINFKDEG